MVGLSVLRNKLDIVANVLVLVFFVISWTWCSPYFGLSVLRNKLVLVGFPEIHMTLPDGILSLTE